MTRNEAERQGLYFAGIYELWYDKEKVKERAKIIRTKYKCRAVVVKEDNGYSVYAENKYRDLICLELCENKLLYMDSRKRGLLERYQKELKELEEEENKLKEKINNIKGRYSI